MGPLNFERVSYTSLNSRQKENYNFAQISAVLADYGFTTMRLSDDWQGADFIAQHKDGLFLKVQLKSRLWVDTKYKSKEIWICFRASKSKSWYLYPHDDFLCWALENLGIGATAGWLNSRDFNSVSGAYSWPHVPAKASQWLSAYTL
ncbi:MAG: hypothetical protein ACYC9L_03265 [Sulfuricaulis sp.]